MPERDDDPMLKIMSLKKISKYIGRTVSDEMLIPLDEMKNFIKPKEICSIVKQFSIKKDDDYLINTLILTKIFSEVKNWVLGIQLAQMASEGELEAMWDCDENCMIFKSK